MNAILIKRVVSPYLLMAFLSLLLAACVEMPANAPIDDRTNPIKPNPIKTDPLKTDPLKSEQKPGEPVKPAELIADKPGFYTVRQGDTLLRIAQQFNQNLRDLVDWNKLSNANTIKVGQSLRVQRPEGMQVSTVQLDSGIETRPLNSNSSTPQPTQNPVSGLAKSGPLGNKIPYSDQALADLQRAEAGSPARGLEAQRKPAETKTITGRFIWPTDGAVVQTFEESKKGIDIAGQAGQPIVAAADGTVLYAKNMRGYGNLIILDHTDGIVSAYAHNKTILVREGQGVKKGQKIAEMGDADSDVFKLHFEIRQLGKVIDPVPLLPLR